jgi:hypothetical protein
VASRFRHSIELKGLGRAGKLRHRYLRALARPNTRLGAGSLSQAQAFFVKFSAPEES